MSKGFSTCLKHFLRGVLFFGKYTSYRFLLIFVFLGLFSGSIPKAFAADNLSLYTDSLNSTWVNWSWGSSISFTNTNPVLSGLSSISFLPNPWGALYLHSNSLIDLSFYTQLKFAVRSSQGSPKLKLLFYDSNNQLHSTNLDLGKYGGDPIAGSFKQYSIPVSDIPIKTISGIAFQEASGNSQPAIYIDDLFFEVQVTTTLPSPTPTNVPIVPTSTPILTPTPTLISIPIPTPTQASLLTQTVYADSLVNGWVNWSWGANVNFAASSAFAGSKAIAFSPYSAWAGLYLHKDQGISTVGYSALRFTAKASALNQKFSIVLYDSNNQMLTSFTSIEPYGGPLTLGVWKTYTIPLPALNASNKLVKGIAIQDSLGQAQPTLYIDEIFLDLSTTVVPTPTNVPLTAVPTPAPVVLSGFTTTNNAIYKNGEAIQLRGVNWFGFETGTHVAHGLWVRNWKDMINQMKNLGFNAVRLPVCPQTLQGVSVNSIDYSKNSDLTGLNSLQVLDKVVNQLNASSIYVLLDHHTPDCQTISDLWYTPSYSETQWINDLKSLAARYKGLPYVIGIDLKNEPHGLATWGSGNSSTDWNTAAEKAGQAVLATNPDLLVFIEGIGESSSCSSNYSHFWGQNLEVVKCRPLALSAIPKQKLVLSPHIYGPDVSWQSYFGDASFPNNMSTVWETQFGYLTAQGFTLVPGEWGGKYGANDGNPKDVALQNALVSYYKTKQMCSSFYWSFNPNSGDTGGVLQDDWITPWPAKLSFIQNYHQTCQ